MAAEHEDTGDGWTWAAMEPDPTDTERRLLDQFALEYAIDGDSTAAASRCGFQAAFAPEYGKRFITKSYVQRKLRELREAAPDEDAESRYNQRVVMHVLRGTAMNPYAKHSARVQAAKVLADIEGMTVRRDPQADEGVGGGVIVVPAIASIEAWEAAAAGSQDALAEASRVE